MTIYASRVGKEAGNAYHANYAQLPYEWKKKEKIERREWRNERNERKNIDLTAH